MRISDWSSDVCSSDLLERARRQHGVDDAAGGMADQVQADGRQRAGLDRAELLEQLDRTGRARGRERIRVLLHLAPQLPAQRPRQALEQLVLPVVQALLEALPARSAQEPETGRRPRRERVCPYVCITGVAY